MKVTYLLALSLLISTSISAKEYRIATMIPKKTPYADALDEFNEKVKEATENRVSFRFRYGGLEGPEDVALQKLNRGQQLDGGIFTAKTLSDIFQDIRVMEVPFSFKDRAHSRRVLNELRPYFAEGLKNANTSPNARGGQKDAGFQSLGFYETGEIYLASTNEISNVNELKKQKVWLLGGDKLAQSFISAMDLVAKQANFHEVLNQLSTKQIDTVYAPSLGLIALQWNTRVSHLVEPPFAYHFQGFILSNRAWNKIQEKDRKVILKLVEEYEKKISDVNLAAADEAFKTLTEKNGIKVVKWPESDIKDLQTLRGKITENLTGSVISKEVATRVSQLL